MDCDSLRTQTSRPIVWIIAGNDCGGGAGLAADLLTIHDFGGHACPVVSSVTAQNSLTLRSAEAVSAKILLDQLDVLAADLPPVAIKIGLLPTIEHVTLLAEWLAAFKAKQTCFVVLDPVVITSQGGNMAEQDIRDALLTKLLPQLDLITPNLNELIWLLQLPSDHFSSADYPLPLLEAASAQLREFGVGAVLCKGGHFNDVLTRDYFSDGTQRFVLESERVVTRHGHGTGCTLASAIATLVAQGYDITDALAAAKAYVQQGLRQAQAIGQGPGPVLHAGWPEQAIDFPLPRWVIQQDGVWQLEASFLVEGFPATDHQLGLYPVVDSVAWIEKLLQWGVRTLQLRVKNPDVPDLEQQIQQAIELGKRYQARLFINDYWQLAIKHGAYGVHLGQEDLQVADLNAIRQSGLRFGISTHGFFELARAFALQPSYIALGHIFPTQTKEMPSQPQGLQRLDRYVALASDFPTVAIGGISEERVPEVQVSGVGSIALVSAITKASDPKAATERLLRLVEGHLPKAVVYD
jgi:hydroxymethylpyrimidine kinase/phosphomethylpyrimidine kinase/thiamine-phosphate diphosphorylase